MAGQYEVFLKVTFMGISATRKKLDEWKMFDSLTRIGPPS